LDDSRYHYDGAWWRHEAPIAAEMMEEARKSGRQEVKRVSSLKDDSQVAIVRSVLNSKGLLHKNSRVSTMLKN